jgi:hypothetical protein
LQILFYFVLSSPNQKDCTTIDAKFQVFLCFSQQTLVYVSRVLETLYLLTFHQALFSQSTMLRSIFFFLSPPSPSSFLGVDFGAYNSSGLVSRFHDGKVVFKHLSILILHFSNRDMNLKTLKGECIQR